MDEPMDRSRVASHAEYARARRRCPGCGERVPDERTADGRTCVRCA
ncbi:MAG: hypothetical protein ABEH40_06200 [Haloferacaceae archaeon]